MSDSIILTDPGSSGPEQGQSKKSKWDIRPGSLPVGWPKYLPNSTPIDELPSLSSWLAREIVAETYVPTIYKNKVDWSKLNQSEKYACASSVWSRTAIKLQYQGTGFKANAREELIRRYMYGCYPAGVEIRWGNSLQWKCHAAICPHCYARKVVEMFSDLSRAFYKRPKDSKIWIAPFYLVGDRKKFLYRLRKLRPAAAAVLYHPIGKTLTEPNMWSIRGVMLTDNPKLVKPRKYRRRIYKAGGIAKALARWMRYPVGWYRRGVIKTAGEMVHIFANIPPNTRRYSTHGVCRKDCIPGKSLFDFKGNDNLISGYTPGEDV